MASASFLHIDPKGKKKNFFMPLTFILSIKKKHKIYVNLEKDTYILCPTKNPACHNLVRQTGTSFGSILLNPEILR